MYRILDDNADREAFAPLRDAAHRRVVQLVTTRQLPAAWQHLAGMVEAGYRSAGVVVDAVRPGHDALDDAARAVLAPAWTALLGLTQAQRHPDDDSRRRAHEARMAMIQSQSPL
jgi:hypothetical protein